jgi:hypothetical protein
MTAWPDADRVARVVELVIGARGKEGGLLLMGVLSMFVATRSEAVRGERQRQVRIYLERARAARRGGDVVVSTVLEEIAAELAEAS